MFLNAAHQSNFETLENQFPSGNSRTRKTTNIIFSIPAIFNAFEKKLTNGEFTPIDLAFLHLDSTNASDVHLSRGEEEMIRLSIELWNGAFSLERGTFKLYDALSHWDDEYVSLFYFILETVRPTAATQQ